MLFENKEKRYKRLLLFIIPLCVLLIVFGVLTYFSISSIGKGTTSPKSSYDIKEYDYHLRSNATDLQKELFKELETLIKDGTDDLSIAESIAKNYVADTYTWDNKKGQWDIGGMHYIYSPLKQSFYYRIKDKFYGFLNKYIDEYGNAGLLEVTNVEIETSEKINELYAVDGKQYECFYVCCKWDYSENSRFANQISNRQYFRIIKNEEGRFEIVECFGDEY